MGKKTVGRNSKQDRNEEELIGQSRNSTYIIKPLSYLQLWSELKTTTQSMQEAWCILGDFNSILHTGDRIEGNVVADFEIKHFAYCIKDCELLVMRSNELYLSWPNKTVWSRIDWVLTNPYWYATLDYVHVECMTQSLLDHIPYYFNFQHVKDPAFKEIVSTHIKALPHATKMKRLQLLLRTLGNLLPS
ncbi:hypothetical protein Cgig2_017423 [Carnegiea gigantea]|uniref:Endonuclease/exonuclease/phosphatase domain-containing protein n=1 Tax=Carnegiea gigantea TaxID=171969 RepID=A0A9Q1Q7J3_9CARY|nr:hypothetical protein Cgig2_017423 [Carnegiea gigantea]